MSENKHYFVTLTQFLPPNYLLTAWPSVFLQMCIFMFVFFVCL